MDTPKQQQRTGAMRYSSPRPWLLAIGISLVLWAGIWLILRA
jgi:hypothetical protein